MKLLKRISFGILVVVLPTLVVMTGKFYMEKQLTFEQSSMWIWTIFTIMISFSMITSCRALKKCEKIEKQNMELKNLILDLTSQSENRHYESIEYMQNTRELLLSTEE